jgi:hypothetical protein
MMDVRPGGFQMANPECTCQVTVKPGVQRESTNGPGKDPDAPDDNPDGEDTVLPSRECPPDPMKTLAEGFAQLRAQLLRDLGQGA